MGLTRLAIFRPLVVLMLVLAIIVVGLISYTRLGVDLLPNINFPVVSIVTVYPDAGPESVESQVTQPIEDAIAGISGIDFVQSTTAEGTSIINVVFTDKVDMNTAASDVERRVNAIRGSLPSEALAPSIVKADVQALPIMNLALSGPQSLDRLHKLADEEIAPRLSSVTGVASVTLVGGLEREIVVKVDQARLRGYGLSLLQINQALAQENVEVPGGSLTEQGRDYNLRLNALVESPDRLGDIVVASTPAGLIYLRDVATVHDAFKQQTNLQRVNGQEAVGILVTKQSDANTLQVADGVKQAIASLQSTMPVGVQLDVVTDASVFTRESLNDVQRNLIEAVVLTAFVLLLFLHAWRSTLIVLLAIPTSLIATFGVMYALGFTMNMMSMLGLALTVGILVDDSIVVLENIYRHLELGETPWTAALKGRSEIGLAAIAITLVDVVVFLPVAFMSGVVGGYFREFGLVIATATLFSLFISFTLTPMLASRWLRSGPGRQTSPETLDPEQHSSRPGRRGLSPARFGERFGDVWERGYDRLTNFYGSTLRHALRLRWLVVFIGFASLFAGIALVPLGLLKSEFMPTSDTGEFTINVEMPPGAALETTDQAVATIEDRLLEWPEVERAFTSIGVSNGLSPDQTRFARIAVKLVDRSKRQKSVEQLAQEARRLGEGIPGIQVRAELPSFVGISGQPIQVLVEGPDQTVLGDLAAKVETIVRETPGTIDVTNSSQAGQPEISISVDRQRAADFGLTAAQAASVLRTSIAGDVVTKFRPEGGKSIDVRVIASDADRASVDKIASIPLVTPTGAQVSLGQIAEISEAAGPAQILRRDRQRQIIVSSSLEGRTLGDISAEIQNRVQALELPQGYEVKLSGETQAQDESFTEIAQALGLSILLIYMLMVALYESLLYPFIIMLSLPLALVGAFGGLVVSGNTLNMISMIGMIMLTGLVGKNAILLVDYTNTLRKRGLARDDALIEAGKARLRPILMTTSAMVLAMFPLALKFGQGAEWRSPMAVVVMGGLLTSTALTLLLIPAVYTIFDDIQTKVFRRPAFQQPTAALAPAGGSE